MKKSVDFNDAIPLLKENGVEFAGVFGSFTRGENTKKSDIDILIRFSEPKSLLKIIGLEMDLSEALDKKVDLVTEQALCPHIKENVFKDLQLIYGRR